jgi:hypothetical protein
VKESKTVNRRDLFLGVMAGGAGLVGTGAAAAPSAWPAGPSERGEVDVLAVLPDVTPGVQSSVEGLTVGRTATSTFRALASTRRARSPAMPCSS